MLQCIVTFYDKAKEALDDNNIKGLTWEKIKQQDVWIKLSAMKFRVSSFFFMNGQWFYLTGQKDTADGESVTIVYFKELLEDILFSFRTLAESESESE